MSESPRSNRVSPERRQVEAKRRNLYQGRDRKWLPLRAGFWLPRLTEWAFRLTGQREAARKEARDWETIRHTLPCRGLPPAFAGQTLLHLSDFHINNQPDLVRNLLPFIQGVRADFAVLTGDFVDDGYPVEESVRLLSPLIEALPRPVLAVLGNHDTAELIAPLEALGVQVLMNEHVVFRQGQDSLAFVGVDDPGYFGADDLPAALHGLEPDIPWICLAHEPSLYLQAAASGAMAYLCGHTHGGQICLPGGRPLIWRSKVPRRLAAGSWNVETLSGYTHRGTGCGTIPLRWNCRPEITLHQLAGADPSGLQS